MAIDINHMTIKQYFFVTRLRGINTTLCNLAGNETKLLLQFIIEITIIYESENYKEKLEVWLNYPLEK